MLMKHGCVACVQTEVYLPLINNAVEDTLSFFYVILGGSDLQQCALWCENGLESF